MALAVYAHATGLCKEVWRPVVRLVEASGVPATPYLFDFKGHGSRGLTDPIADGDTWDGFAVDDVLAAVARAQQIHGGNTAAGPLPVIGVGHSFGGAALVKVRSDVR